MAFFQSDLIHFIMAGLTVRFPSISNIVSISTETLKGKKLFATGTVFKKTDNAGFDMVISGVLRKSRDFKIFNPVVGFDSVDVMNDFDRKGEELSSKMVFHNNSMLSDLFSFNANKSVPKTRCGSFPVGVFLSKERVSELFKSSVMYIAESFALVFFKALFNRATFHSQNNKGIVSLCQ